jgi:uncharacterized protein (DUF58 family)
MERARRAVFQPRGAEQGDVFLNQRRVFVLPTSPGLALVVMLAALLLGSINYSLSLGFALTFLFAGVAWVGMFYTFRNLAHLTLRPARVDPVFAGQIAEFHVMLVNQHRYDRYAIDLNADQQFAATSADAPSLGSVTVMVPVKVLRRGYQPMPRITLATTFPIGLWRSWSYWQPDLRALVYPEPAPPGEPLPVNQGEGQDGESHSGPGSEDYAGIRPYAAGDVVRHLAWKAMARSPSDALLTKMFSGAAQRELWLDLSQVGGHLGLENGLSLMTRWVLDCEAGDSLYGLRLPGVEFAPARGEAHRQRCLEALALYRSPA